MKKTLYEITGDALAVYEELENNRGELTTELEQALTISQNEIKSKGVAYLEVVKSKASFINDIDTEIKRLTAMKKVAYLEVVKSKASFINDIDTEIKRLTAMKKN